MLPSNDRDDLQWTGQGEKEERQKWEPNIENYPRCSSYGSLPLELSEGWEDSQLYGSALKHFLNGMLKIDLSARLSVLHGTNLDLASCHCVKLAKN